MEEAGHRRAARLVRACSLSWPELTSEVALAGSGGEAGLS